ncbi:MAG: glycoside hydrolase family 43 protein [Anaerolineae bacterium]
MRRGLIIVIIVLIVAAVLALSLLRMNPQQAATPATVAQATVAPPAAVAASGAGNKFTNPVVNRDFADPDTLKVGDAYYAYATNANGMNVQVARSMDMVNWDMPREALPALPHWASLQSGLTWAPEVWTSADGKTYVMYFVTRDTASDKQCIGLATSDKPEGPFKARDDKPFICQVDEGGTIDAASFVDTDGSRYVLFKNDGNCCNITTRIYIQKVSSDGLTLEGKPTALIENDQAWEGHVVEAPTLWKHNNKYYLFYSANNYAGADYAVGYAVADNILGPYTKPLSRPFVATQSDPAKGPPVIGPGGQDIIVDENGRTWLMYHSWDPTISFRWVSIDPLDWEGDKPVLRGPSRQPQPAP